MKKFWDYFCSLKYVIIGTLIGYTLGELLFTLAEKIF